MKSNIRLSQCMIVKNEEKNIRQALSWGKDLVWEQIVVDTGSTDRTVEIAASLGAKIFHFTWIDDFSAAKNHAIEQAQGDWIIFLDADEYFSGGDVPKIGPLIEKIEKIRPMDRPHGIITALLNLNDQGKIFSATTQQRIFRRSPHIRYVNTIHERLAYTGPGRFHFMDASSYISIYHTGYGQSSIGEQNKASRNLALLYKELEANPGNRDCWSYLGDALYISDRLDEAYEAYQKSLENPGAPMLEVRRNLSYATMMKILARKGVQEGLEEKLTALYQDFLQTKADYPDVEYWMGYGMLLLKKRKEGVFYLEKALKGAESYKGYDMISVTSQLQNIYQVLAMTCFDMGDKPPAVRYATLSLRMDRYQNTPLHILLGLLKEEPGASQDATSVYNFLAKLYDFSFLKDKLFVMKAAKELGFSSLDNLLYDSMRPEEQAWLTQGRRSSYLLADEKFQKRYPQISICNETDTQFLALMEETAALSQEELLENIQGTMGNFQKQVADYFTKFPFWGRLVPEEGVYEALEKRAAVLKNHREDFLWLYENLADYRSKKTLLAILANWLRMDIGLLAQVKENGPCYFDQDLVPSGKNQVFVDLGAYTGDTVRDFVHSYGEGYEKIYCYEITPEMTERLRANLRHLDRVEIRQKAASSGPGTVYVSANPDASANQAGKKAEKAGQVPIEAVSLDDHIPEPVTWIKMDIEGSEWDALEGCQRHVSQEHPILTICVYHGYDHIWQIPRRIMELDGSYQLYLRHYGGNLVPTEFVLYAI